MRYLMLVMVFAGSMAGTPVRSIYIDGYADMLGPDREVSDCLKTKLAELGPFTFPATADGADATLTLDAKIPSGSGRVLMGRSPSVHARLTQPGAKPLVIENKYKKGTTVWGGGTDMACGLANGLANKLVKELAKRENR